MSDCFKPAEQQVSDRQPGTPLPSISVSNDLLANAAGEEQLKSEILRLWSQHQKAEAAIAPLLYLLRAELSSQGKKGSGFEQWLKKHGIPKTTAYRWIARYEAREGLRTFVVREKNPASSATSSQVERGLTALPAAEYVPPPHTVPEFLRLAKRFLQTLDSDARAVAINDLSVGVNELVADILQAQPTDTPASSRKEVALIPPQRIMELLDSGSFSAIYEAASTLVETPTERLGSELAAFAPDSGRLVMMGDPEYRPFEDSDYSEQLSKAQGYKQLLQTALEATSRNGNKIRRILKRVEKLISNLQDRVQPLYRVVWDEVGHEKQTVKGAS